MLKLLTLSGLTIEKCLILFFEVEHTTDFKNSINKFFELQDFKANFYVVTKKERKKEFENILNSSIYLPIKKLLKFAVYESIVKQFEFQKRKFKS